MIDITAVMIKTSPIAFRRVVLIFIPSDASHDIFMPLGPVNNIKHIDMVIINTITAIKK
jgi:hypothetical protein